MRIILEKVGEVKKKTKAGLASIHDSLVKAVTVPKSAVETVLYLWLLLDTQIIQIVTQFRAKITRFQHDSGALCYI